MNATSNSAPAGAPQPDAAAGRLIADARVFRRLARARLARLAGLDARRLADIEAGRSCAGPGELLALAAALDLPLRRRNALFVAAGHAPLYKEWSLADPAMAGARRAITLMLSRHEPWPAFVIDRDWTVLAANDAGQRLARLMLGESRMGRPMNLMTLFLAPDELRRHIINWPAFAGAMLRRAGIEAAAAPEDPAVQSAWSALLALPDVAGLLMADPAPSPEPLCEVRFVSQQRELGLIPTTLVFSTPVDPALTGLRIEAFLPSDDESETLLLALAGGA